jgi:hypothetical protein
MTNVNNDTLKQLNAPFPSATIQWRVGSTNQDKTRGKALPYIDARVVQNRLDEVVGPSNWKNSYSEVIVDGKLLAVRCALALKVDGEWVEKEDGAHLDNIETFDQAEKAIKGVYSDALKRAGVQWGIGRYLYEFDAPWVDLDNGRLLQAPRLPNEMLPEAERIAAPAKRTETKPAAQPAPEAKAEVKAETKPEIKVEAKPEAKVEAKPEAKVEAKPEPKPEPAAQAPADVAASVLNPQGATAAKSEDDERRERADQMADQAAAKQPAAKAEAKPEAKPEVKPEPTPVATVQNASNDGGDEGGDELPADISEEQRKLVDEMLQKMKKLPAHMLRSYIDGPRGKDKFTEEVRVFLLKKLAQAEAKAAAAAAA